MNIKIPDNFDETTDSELESLKADLTAEFDEKYDSETPTPLAELTEIATAIDAVNAEIGVRESAAESDAVDRAALAERVRPAAEVDEEAADADADPAADPAAEVAEEAADVLEPVAASAKPKAPSARALATRGVTPPAAEPKSDVVITAAADIPGVTNGSALDRTGVAKAMMARARGLANGSPRVGIASVMSNNKFVVGEDGGSTAFEVMEAAVADQLKGQTAAALVASGGFCTPSETMYDLFSVESRDGLIDLPTIGISRGGIQVPSYVGLGDVAAALWSWTEADDVSAGATFAITDIDIVSNVATATAADHGLLVGYTVLISGASLGLLNGRYTVATVADADTFTFAKVAADSTNATATGRPVKGCLMVPCSTWVDYRLEAEGLCVTAGNMIKGSYPELVARTIDLTMTAHLHRMSNAKLASILAAADEVTVTTAPSDVAGDVLAAIDLQVADFRSEYLMGDGTVLDGLFPQWFKEAIRSSLAMRAGVNTLSVSDAEITGYITARNVRPQFLAGYDPLFNTSPATAFPATGKFTLMPTGSVVVGEGDSIDLGVVRDSTLNETNDYTAAWSEQFYTTIQRGPVAREVTVTTDVTGQTGGDAIAP